MTDLAKIRAALLIAGGTKRLDGTYLDDDCTFTEALALVGKLEAAQAEIEAVRKANIDCVNHFDALRIDYDAALARLAKLEKQDDSNAGVVMGFTPEGLALVDYPCEGNTISLEEGMLLYAASGAAPKAQEPLSKEALTDIIAAGLGLTYHCTRVWSAWQVGTMSEHDFEPVDGSDTPAEIADAIIAAHGIGGQHD